MYGIDAFDSDVWCELAINWQDKETNKKLEHLLPQLQKSIVRNGQKARTAVHNTTSFSNQN